MTARATVRRRVRLVVGVVLAYATALVVHWHDGQTVTPTGSDADPIALVVFAALVVVVVLLSR